MTTIDPAFTASLNDAYKILHAVEVAIPTTCHASLYLETDQLVLQVNWPEGFYFRQVLTESEVRYPHLGRLAMFAHEAIEYYRAQKVAK